MHVYHRRVNEQLQRRSTSRTPFRVFASSYLPHRHVDCQVQGWPEAQGPAGAGAQGQRRRRIVRRSIGPGPSPIPSPSVSVSGGGGDSGLFLCLFVMREGWEHRGPWPGLVLVLLSWRRAGAGAGAAAGQGDGGELDVPRPARSTAARRRWGRCCMCGGFMCQSVCGCDESDASPPPSIGTPPPPKIVSGLIRSDRDRSIGVRGRTPTASLSITTHISIALYFNVPVCWG